MPQKSILLLLTAACLLSCTTPPQQSQSSKQPDPPRKPSRVATAFPVATPPAAASYFPANMPPTRADSLILIDARSGRTLAQKNADRRRPVASLQKLLTALVVLDAGHLRRRVLIRPEDTRVEPSKLYLKAGESYTRATLLNAILIRSANDAALALARDNAGSIAAFARKMNAKARRFGAKDSRFVNPHGLTAKGQYSTARDVARIAFAAARHPFIQRAVNRRSYAFYTPRGRKIIENTNNLLERMRACTGMKTGYTKASGRCLATSASFGRKHVILVQLGSQTKYIFNDAARLMSWAASPRKPTYAFAPITQPIGVPGTRLSHPVRSVESLQLQ